MESRLFLDLVVPERRLVSGFLRLGGDLILEKICASSAYRLTKRALVKHLQSHELVLVLLAEVLLKVVLRHLF